jgi:hypothetical protein
MRDFFASLHFSRWSVPLALAVVSSVAFGLLLPFWGFYLDDWHHLYFSYNGGAQGLQDFFLFDGRPIAYLFYTVGFRVLGYNPLAWQIAAISLRTVTAVLIWICLREIWREHEREAVWTAVLFLIYPLFRQQQFSIAYSMHWFGYALYMLSIWLMVLAVKRPARFAFFTILSLAASFGHLIFLEYFAGLELIRPVILWILVSRESTGFMARLRRTFLLWVPYLFLWIAFVVYRLYLMPTPKPGYERNQLLILSGLLEAPVQTALHFIQSSFQDTLTILFSSWQNAINPALINFQQPANLLAMGFAFLSAISLFFYFTRLQIPGDGFDPHHQPVEALPTNRWWVEAFALGLLLVLLGLLPIWLTDQFIVTDNPLWSDRYSLAGLLGASLAVVALIAGFVANPKYRTALLSLLVGLAIGWHLLVGNEYRWSWTAQTQFFHQLSWRAPYIEPGTTLLAEGELFSRMTEYETAFAISTLYPKANKEFELDYWFFSLSRRFSDRMEELLDGTPIRYNRFYTVFRGQSKDSLVISYAPETNQCLWVLAAEDQEYSDLPELTRQAAPISNLALIQQNGAGMRPIPTEIFGPDPGRNWCYYYQKADLARQFEEWSNIVDLWEEAAQQGNRPAHGRELMPFIDGFARSGDWNTASDLTNRAIDLTPKLRAQLCTAWQNIQAQTVPSPERNLAMTQMRDTLNCDLNANP